MKEDIIVFKNNPCIVLDDYEIIEDYYLEENIQILCLYGAQLIWLYKSKKSEKVYCYETDQIYIRKKWRRLSNCDKSH